MGRSGIFLVISFHYSGLLDQEKEKLSLKRKERINVLTGDDFMMCVVNIV